VASQFLHARGRPHSVPCGAYAQLEQARAEDRELATQMTKIQADMDALQKENRGRPARSLALLASPLAFRSPLACLVGDLLTRPLLCNPIVLCSRLARARLRGCSAGGVPSSTHSVGAIRHVRFSPLTPRCCGARRVQA